MIKRKHIPIILFTAVAIALIGVGSYYYYIYFGILRCPACGMMITSEMMENFITMDLRTNQKIYVCCPGCALRLVAAYSDLRIEMLDSWYGRAAPTIKIEIKNGTLANVMPETTRMLLGGRITGSCTHNRIAINETSIGLLLEKGWNPYNPLTVFKTTLPEGTPVLTIAKALPGLKERGIEYKPPSSLFLGSIIIIGIAILITSIILWRKMVRSLPSNEVVKK